LKLKYKGSISLWNKKRIKFMHRNAIDCGYALVNYLSSRQE
jgi:hypothetical protein